MVRTGEWVSRAWAVVMSDVWHFALLMLVVLLITSTGVGGLLTGPLMCSVFLITHHKLDTGRFEWNLFGRGFDYLLHALLAALVSGVFIAFGYALLIIPGLILTAGYLFCYLVLIDQNCDFWTAMETSRQQVFANLMGWIGFLLVLALINVAGALLCGVGLFITIPHAWVATTIAYREAFPRGAAASIP